MLDLHHPFHASSKHLDSVQEFPSLVWNIEYWLNVEQCDKIFSFQTPLKFVKILKHLPKMKRRTAKKWEKESIALIQKNALLYKKHIFLGKKSGFLLFSRILSFYNLKLSEIVQLPRAEIILLTWWPDPKPEQGSDHWILVLCTFSFCYGDLQVTAFLKENELQGRLFWQITAIIQILPIH